MAASAGKTPNGVRVNNVYTPPPLRGRGYASACVAHLSQELLDEVNKELKNGRLRISKEKVAGSGGFVLEEEKTRTQVTWEVLIGQARRELEPELSKKLFADQQDKAKNRW